MDVVNILFDVVYVLHDGQNILYNNTHGDNQSIENVRLISLERIVPYHGFCDVLWCKSCRFLSSENLKTIGNGFGIYLHE